MNEIYSKINPKIQNDLVTLPFERIICTNEGKRLSKSLIEGYLDYLKLNNDQSIYYYYYYEI